MSTAAGSGERQARAALSRLMEPSDWVGLALVAAVGPVDALRIATGALAPGRSLQGDVQELLGRAAEDSGARTLAEALERWAPRARESGTRPGPGHHRPLRRDPAGAGG